MSLALGNRGDRRIRAAICLARPHEAGEAPLLRHVADERALPRTNVPQIPEHWSAPGWPSPHRELMEGSGPRDTPKGVGSTHRPVGGRRRGDADAPRQLPEVQMPGSRRPVRRWSRRWSPQELLEERVKLGGQRVGLATATHGRGGRHDEQGRVHNEDDK